MHRSFYMMSRTAYQRVIGGRSRRAVVVLVAMGVAGCKDLTGSGQLPAGTPNPSFYNSASGAIGLRDGAIADLDRALGEYIVASGLIADELQDPASNASQGTLLQTGGEVNDPLDERILPEGATGGHPDPANSYNDLQQFRGAANIAVHALAAYDTASADRPAQQVMRGELYALQGYSEILLADLYCSGVPLSTLDFQGDFTYAPSSNTIEVYHDAIRQLDSARALATSDSVANLARVLQGRAYLDLGMYDSAAATVAAVPPGFQYILSVPLASAFGIDGAIAQATVADREGVNGLSFRSGEDIRDSADATCISPQNGCYNLDTIYAPHKYAAQFGNSYGMVHVIVADGVEAQLITAESQLQPTTQAANGPWLTTLNHLRSSVSLPDTSDPGTPAGRISLLFHERAYWLFVTGHRQGDLRRLIRQYGLQYSAFQSQDHVYPVGTYTAPGTGRYGADVTVPIPPSENANPDFHGCIDRDP